MKEIVVAIRKLCEKEHGFIDLFSKEKGFTQLCNLVGNTYELSLFEKLMYGKARDSLLTLIHDVYSYKEYEVKVLADLMSDGLTKEDAIKALEIFYTAFGFPNYREMIINPISEFTSYEKETFKTVYVGETLNGLEYGVGRRNNYFEGESCGWDECVWINGKMFGYCYSLDIEFKSYETKKYGFVVNDTYIGKYMNIYEDGEEGYMQGVNLDIV